jgi:hypothetical protein
MVNSRSHHDEGGGRPPLMVSCAVGVEELKIEIELTLSLVNFTLVGWMSSWQWPERLVETKVVWEFCLDALELSKSSAVQTMQCAAGAEAAAKGEEVPSQVRKPYPTYACEQAPVAGARAGGAAPVARPGAVRPASSKHARASMSNMSLS